MSTEFFFEWPKEEPCSTCGHVKTKPDIEFGHHGGGWQFLFRANKELEIVTVDQWWRFFDAYITNANPGGRIYDNNGHREGLEMHVLRQIVVQARGKRSRAHENPGGSIVTDGYHDIDMGAYA